VATELSYTQPKARKIHKCVWCGEPILIGEQHHKWVGIFEGDFNNWRMHDECWDAADRERSEDYHSDGSFEPHEHKRGMTIEERMEEEQKAEKEAEAEYEDMMEEHYEEVKQDCYEEGAFDEIEDIARGPDEEDMYP